MPEMYQGARHTSRRPARLAPFALLAAALTGCASEPAAPPSPSPTATQSASPSPSPSPSPTPEPSPSPTPTNPNDRSELLVEPEAMKEMSDEGAIAAAKYFMGLYEYVFLTGDLEKWEYMATANCRFCTNVANSVRELHAKGRHRVSGPPEWLGKPRARQIPNTFEWEVHLRARVSGSRTLDEEGREVARRDSGIARAHVLTSWDGLEWRIDAVSIEDE
jgi:Predicted solute binding protein